MLVKNNYLQKMMNQPIWVDQEIEKLITYSPLNRLLVARAGIATLNILTKALYILGTNININDHIKSHCPNLKPYFIESLESDTRWINRLYNYLYL